MKSGKKEINQNYYGKVVVPPPETINWDPVKQEDIKEATEDHDALLGYKGDSFLQSGAVFAPYIPITNSKTNASINKYGYVIECPGEGIYRYIYDPKRDGDINALTDIEEKGLIVLDDNEEEQYINAIEPKTMAENVKRGGPPKLKATWTVESDQDLQAYHSVEVEDKIASFVSSYIKKQYGNL